MQNFVRQWTKKSTGQCVRWFEKSTGQFKKPPAFVRFPVLNTIPAPHTDTFTHTYLHTYTHNHTYISDTRRKRKSKTEPDAHRITIFAFLYSYY